MLTDLEVILLFFLVPLYLGHLANTIRILFESYEDKSASITALVWFVLTAGLIAAFATYVNYSRHLPIID